MGKKPKLQKKPEERKTKVKPGKSQQQKGNSVVNEEENSAEMYWLYKRGGDS